MLYVIQFFWQHANRIRTELSSVRALIRLDLLVFFSHLGILLSCLLGNSNWVPSWSCSQAVNKPVWHIPLLLLCVQWKTPDDGQTNCPKHVEFYSKNKFEKLLYLVCFIIRIYHDARSLERQIRVWFFDCPKCPGNHNWQFFFLFLVSVSILSSWTFETCLNITIFHVLYQI